MTITFSRHDLQNDVSAAVRATESGPVMITENGDSAYVLLSFKDYQALGGSSPHPEQPGFRSLYDALAAPEFKDLAEIELDIPLRSAKENLRVPDFD